MERVEQGQTARADIVKPHGVAGLLLATWNLPAFVRLTPPQLQDARHSNLGWAGLLTQQWSGLILLEAGYDPKLIIIT